MAEYVKCPRCDLNYMKKGEEYCDVCKAELKKGPQLIFAVDDIDDDVDAWELCPICHQNHVKPGESMCAKCAEERDYKDSREDPDDESWKEFLDDEEDEEEEDEEMLSLNKLAEEEGEFDDEEEEEIVSEEEPDDFDIPDVDSDDFIGDDEDDEDEDDEDDEEDY